MNRKAQIRETEIRQYDTPDGYINALRQLSARGYNYFVPVKKSRTKSSMLIGKIKMPRSTATLH